MAKFVVVLLLLATVLTASCSPGGTPASTPVPTAVPAAQTPPTEKQQITTFMKALLPMEMESRALINDFDVYLDARTKLTKAERDAKEAAFLKRSKAIIDNANAISRPKIAELQTFYNAWLAYQVNYDGMLNAGVKGDVTTMSAHLDKFEELDKAWRVAVNNMLIKYGLGASELGWPKD